jgi:hypothetical protein
VHKSLPTQIGHEIIETILILCGIAVKKDMNFLTYTAVVLMVGGLSFRGMAQQVIHNKEMKTIQIPESQTEAFMQVNPRLFSESRKIYRCSFLTLNNLAKAAESINDPEVLNCLYSLLVFEDRQNQVLKNYLTQTLEKQNNTVSIDLHDQGEE